MYVCEYACGVRVPEHITVAVHVTLAACVPEHVTVPVHGCVLGYMHAFKSVYL